MYPILFHIWGPLFVHSYGLMIAVGAFICLQLVKRDAKLLQLISYDGIISLAMIIFGASIIGGRILFAYETSDATVTFWQVLCMSNGGFSILGSVTASAISLGFYLWYWHYPVIAILDRIVIYMPLLYSISRIGCFLAGCCYGCQTSLAWAVTYTNCDVFAPCFIPLHPTQLYSSAVAFLIFLFFYFMSSRITKRYAGANIGLYLIFMSLERFFVDFLRDDRTGVCQYGFSTMQRYAACVYLVGFGIVLYALYGQKLFKNKEIFKEKI